ncbi:hypothetical protein LCGC14_2902810 [marine sediment metagenome]|uniref:Uncharacterized protein n=1 Tax=marine sediment metagenome TaxID=412755 RepID=A0A0F8XTV3_9ZZZZ
MAPRLRNWDAVEVLFAGRRVTISRFSLPKVLLYTIIYMVVLLIEPKEAEMRKRFTLLNVTEATYNALKALQQGEKVVMSTHVENAVLRPVAHFRTLLPQLTKDTQLVAKIDKLLASVGEQE